MNRRERAVEHRKVKVLKNQCFLKVSSCDLSARGPKTNDSYAVENKMSKPSRQKGGTQMAHARGSQK